jgi:hypothetical protein
MAHGSPTLALVACAAFLAALPASADAADPLDLQEKTQAIATALTDIPLAGWRAAGPVERYVVANLYDKINGRSELFMAYGVLGLAFLSFRKEDTPTQFIDVFLYDMGSAPGAFGAFSVERDEDHEPLDIGRESYRAGDDLFFWKGPYYASILGASKAPAVQQAQTEIARVLADRLDDSNETLWGFDILPKENRDLHSVQYFMIDALSLSFLRDTYTARYDVDSEEITAFVSRAASAAEAAEAREHYVAYMRRYGDDLEERDGGAVVADMGGGFVDVVFVEGQFVAGVTAVSKKSLALEFTEKFREHLRKSARPRVSPPITDPAAPDHGESANTSNDTN